MSLYIMTTYGNVLSNHSLAWYKQNLSYVVCSVKQTN